MEKNEMGGACSADGKRSGVYRVLVGKLEGKRPLLHPFAVNKYIRVSINCAT
jgi:hypothetical protein